MLHAQKACVLLEEKGLGDEVFPGEGARG